MLVHNAFVANIRVLGGYSATATSLPFGGISTSTHARSQCELGIDFAMMVGGVCCLTVHDETNGFRGECCLQNFILAKFSHGSGLASKSSSFWRSSSPLHLQSCVVLPSPLHSGLQESVSFQMCVGEWEERPPQQFQLFQEFK